MTCLVRMVEHLKQSMYELAVKKKTKKLRKLGEVTVGKQGGKI